MKETEEERGLKKNSAKMRPTSSLGIKFRKLALTTKDVKKGFYKGNRTGSMGRHTKHGRYIIEWEKVRTYAVPNLEGFKVRSSPHPLSTWIAAR